MTSDSYRIPPRTGVPGTVSVLSEPWVIKFQG